jgi:hypothetical protein
MENNFTPDKLGANPFRISFRLRVTEVVSKTEYRKTKTGEIEPNTYYIERDKSSKLYKVAGLPDLIDNMTTKAQRLFLFILVRLENGKEYFSLNVKHYMRTNKVSSMRTVNDAIKELVFKGVLCHSSVKYVFFVNPHIMFSGDRLKQFEDNIEVMGTIGLSNTESK